jgi:6-phosphofructokinase 2
MARILTVTLNPALDVSTVTEAVAPNRKLRCAPATVEPGGGGVNVARVAARLGGSATPLVAAGGPTGRRLLDLLRAEGRSPIDLGLGFDARESFSVLEGSTGDQFRFVLPGPLWSAADGARAQTAILRRCRRGDLVVVSGSHPRGAPDAFDVELAASASEIGAMVGVDTSGPALAAAAQAAAGLAFLRLDDAEAAALAGRPMEEPVELAAFAAELVALNAAGVVAIGAGALGTVVACGSRRFLCRPPIVEVVSAIGAGDSFVAAFALRLFEGAGAVEACRWGVAAAAAAVTTPGSRLCERATVERLLPQVVVEAL